MKRAHVVDLVAAGSCTCSRRSRWYWLLVTCWWGAAGGRGACGSSCSAGRGRGGGQPYQEQLEPGTWPGGSIQPPTSAAAAAAWPTCQGLLSAVICCRRWSSKRGGASAAAAAEQGGGPRPFGTGTAQEPPGERAVSRARSANRVCMQQTFCYVEMKPMRTLGACCGFADLGVT